MIFFDAFLYADGKEIDTNQDKLISSSELSNGIGLLNGWGTNPINVGPDVYDLFDDGKATEAIMAVAEYWVSDVGYDFFTSAEDIYSITMRTTSGFNIYNSISNKDFDLDGGAGDGGSNMAALQELFYAAAAADYYNTVNTIGALADLIEPFWPE